MADLRFNARHGISVGNASKTGIVDLVDHTGNITAITVRSPSVFSQVGTGGTLSIKANSTDATGIVSIGSNTSVTGTLGVSGTTTIAALNVTSITATGAFSGTSGTFSTPIGVASGGTNATSSAGALTNLMPGGTGYLKSSGPGTFYWDVGTGPAYVGTRIDSQRTFAIATAAQTEFTAPTYILGSSQVRVYVNGMRLFNSEYTETNTTTVTLGTACTAGDDVMIEVDGYVTYSYVASAVTFSPTGAISSTDVQAAIGELDSEKAAIGQTMYIGTTAVAINRTTATLALTGVSIDGTASTWASARNLAGNSVNGSADVAFSNKFIVQGTVDTGLTGAQFLGALGTGLVKNTTTTGVLSIAVAGTDFAAPNQTFYLGTTNIAINRSSGAMTLSSVDIEGNSAGATNILGGAWTVPYNSSVNVTSKLNIGAAGTVFASTGASSAPVWADLNTIGAASIGDVLALSIALG